MNKLLAIGVIGLCVLCAAKAEDARAHQPSLSEAQIAQHCYSALAFVRQGWVADGVNARLKIVSRAGEEAECVATAEIGSPMAPAEVTYQVFIRLADGMPTRAWATNRGERAPVLLHRPKTIE